MTDLNRNVASTLGKHFVMLSCVQHLPGESPRQILVFSGFMVDVSGEWFYVTAGHILRDIRAAIKAGSHFDIWRFGDQTAGNLFKGSTVPYEFDETMWLVLNDEAAGLDYAAVHIQEFYQRQLEAGGVVAIAGNAWGDHLTEHDYWVLVGTPSESVAYDGRNVITARTVLTPLIAADEPTLAGGKAQNQFYAKPVDGSEKFFKDADGMSGGPVFTLKKVSEQWRYSVIGVQSAWYPSSKTLAICPFSSFGSALEDLVGEVHAIHAGSEGPSSA